MEKKIFPEQDEIVLCNVEKILGTTVFLKILKYGKEGVMATSEVAPGRIRNIRDYVIPGKKIVCRVLRADEKTGHIDLSLRRVTKKEREAIIEKEEHERNALAILRMIAKERVDAVAEKIREKYASVFECFQNIDKANLTLFGLTKEEQEQIIKILKEKPQKKVSLKANITLTSQASDGVLRIKSLFEAALKDKNVRVTYVSAPSYVIEVEAQDYKEGSKKLGELLKGIVQEAKGKECEIEIKE
jgi:translation initiation factor 2 subunit 1